MGSDRRTFLKRLALMAGALAGAWRRSTPATAAASFPTSDQVNQILASEEWQPLKRAWRELTRHANGEVDDKKAFGKLETELTQACAAFTKRGASLGIGTEYLRAVTAAITQRRDYARDRHLPEISCYLGPAGGLHSALVSTSDRLEKQYVALGKLLKDERITPEVAEKAYKVIALRVDILARARRLGEPNAYEKAEDILDEFDPTTSDLRPGRHAGQRSWFVAWIFLELSRP